jgi:hypothetical protein
MKIGEGGLMWKVEGRYSIKRWTKNLGGEKKKK